MPRFLVIQDNTVVNIAEGTQEYGLEAGWESAANGVGIGWTRSRADGPWEPPIKPPSEDWRRFVGNEKLDLFTPQEQMAVVTATMTDPEVKLMYDRLLGAAYLSYEDPETEQGLALLVDKGLLTSERKAEVVQQMLPR